MWRIHLFLWTVVLIGCGEQPNPLPSAKRVFTLPTLVTTIGLKGNPYSLAFSPNSQLLAVGANGESDDQATVSLFSTETWEVIRDVAFDDSLPFVRFAPNGYLFGASGFGGAIRLFDVETGDERAAWSMGGPVTQGISFSSDENRLAVTGTNSVAIWSLERGEIVLKWTASIGIVNSAAFRPGSDEVATAGHGHIVNIWDSTTGESRFKQTSGQGTSLAFSPNGEFVAVLYFPQQELPGGRTAQISVGHILLMRAGDGLVLHDIEKSEATCLGFTPDGQTLVVGGNERYLTFYDASTMQLRGRLPVATEQVTAVALSADGNYLAVASEHDRIVQIWNVSRL